MEGGGVDGRKIAEEDERIRRVAEGERVKPGREENGSRIRGRTRIVFVE